MSYQITAEVDGKQYTFESDVPNPSEQDIMGAVGSFHQGDSTAPTGAPQGGGQLSMGQTLSTLPSALFGKGAPLETPWSQVSNAFPQMAGNAAEKLGQVAANPTFQQISDHLIGMSPGPKTIAALTTPTAILPDIVAAAGAYSPASGAASRVSDIANAGDRIGAAEKAMGVITKAADKYPTSGNVGEVLNTLESQLKNGTLTNPQDLQQANSIVRFIFNNPNIVGKEKAVTAQAARVAGMVSDAFNAAVPGRGPAAADYATLMKYVNASKMAGKIAGVGVGGASALAVLRKFLTAPLGQ